MATYNKINSWAEDMVESVNMGSDAFVAALTTNAAAPTASSTVLGGLTTISYTNLSSRSLTTSTSAQSSGTYTFLLADLTLTASGAVATFRHTAIYDDTPTSPADPLMCWYDYGADVTLATGETFTMDFTTSTFTLA